MHSLFRGLLFSSLGLVSMTQAAEFHRTRVIGFSQVGQPRGGWFVAGKIFESIVDDDRWELLWNGGAGVDRWQDPDYEGWRRDLISPCPVDTSPDRVLLVISGPYGEDRAAWTEAITATVNTIIRKLPSVRHIVLQPVVGGPEGKPCPTSGDRTVRASQQFPVILAAIRETVANPSPDGVNLTLGYTPQVGQCSDFADRLGHLTPSGAEAVAGRIARFYQTLDSTPSP